MKKIVFALALMLSAAAPAAAQNTCPTFGYGVVLTAGQWQACFDAKQNSLGYTPVNRAGDIMQGPLVTFASALASSGFNIPPGVAPISPVNGDIWATSAGLFVRVSGTTIGPLSGATSASYAAVSPILVSFPSGVVTYSFDFTVANKFTALQTISLNAGSLPAALTGTALRVAQADATISRLEIDSFGTAAPGILSVVYGRGTAAAPTAVQSGDEIGSFNSWGYTGAATLSGTAVAAVRTYALETFSSGHQGSQICMATTPTASTTLANSLCQQGSGGVTVGSPTGGDKGAGTINSAGTIYINNVAITAAAITALTGDGTATGPGSAVLTLATVNAGPGSVGSSTAIPVLTTNGKGLVTAQTTAAVIAPAGTLSGTTLASGVVGSSLTGVGTLVSGGTGTGFTLALTLSTVTGTLPCANHPALTGDVTTSAGSCATTIANNAVTNSKVAQMAAFTIKGNTTGSLANASDFTIGGLTQKASPASSDLVLIQDQAASGALKYALVSSIASAGSVSSIAGNTGAFTLGAGLTNSTNNILMLFDPGSITNCTLVGTVSGGALTVALKTQAGADPTSTTPCVVSFRNATVATGDYTAVLVTAATSFSTAASGSTFGTANSAPFRLWITAINNAGTVVLGVSNQSSSTQVFPLDEETFPTTTTCSACGTATAVGTIYSTASQSGKAIRIIGHMDWASGLSTAGTFASGPTTIQLMGPGIRKPGEVVQTISATTTTVGSVSNTTFTALTSGQTVTITRKATPNLVRSFASGSMTSTAGNGAEAKLQLASGSTLVGSIAHTSIATNSGSITELVSPATMMALDNPGTTLAQTYGIFGKGASGTVSYPASGDQSIMILDEIMGALPSPANDDGTDQVRTAA